MKRLLLIPFIALVLTCGCTTLTAEQQARVDKIVVEVTSLRAELETLGEAGEELARLIEATAARVKAGELPLEEGERLLELYRARKASVEAAAENIKLKLSSADRERAALEASGVPGWRVAVEVGVGILLTLAGVNRQMRLGSVTDVAVGLSKVVDKVKEGGYKDGMTLSTLAEVGADLKTAGVIREQAK